MARSRAFCIGVMLAVSVVSTWACGKEHVPLPRRIVDLSPVLTVDVNQQRLGDKVMSFLGTDGRMTFDAILPARPELAFGIDRICLLSHSGSHLDAPARLLRGGEHPGAIPLDRVTGPARVADLRWHNRDSPLQITDLEQTRVEPGDIVVLFVGYRPPTTPEAWPAYPALSAQASEWLVAKRIRALATDMPAVASLEALAGRLRTGQPPEKTWSEYIPLFQAQVPVIAGLVNIEAIAEERDVLFLAFPLRLDDGSGVPVRAAAFVY